MYKSILILTMLMAIALGVKAQEGYDLTVNLTGLDSDEGMALVGLYSSSDNWLGKALSGEKSKITNGELTVVFRNVPAGNYAISAFHDENSNGKLDTGWFGIPTEDYACSRGAVGRFGPPAWEDAVLKLDGNKEINVKF